MLDREVRLPENSPPARETYHGKPSNHTVGCSRSVPHLVPVPLRPACTGARRTGGRRPTHPCGHRRFRGGQGDARRHDERGRDRALGAPPLPGGTRTRERPPPRRIGRAGNDVHHGSAHAPGPEPSESADDRQEHPGGRRQCCPCPLRLAQTPRRTPHPPGNTGVSRHGRGRRAAGGHGSSRP